MNDFRPPRQQKLITLQEASQILGVSVELLLKWNEHNILKPTITTTGHVGYSQDQIQEFLRIRQLGQSNSQEPAKPSVPIPTFQPPFTPLPPVETSSQQSISIIQSTPTPSPSLQQRKKYSPFFLSSIFGIFFVLLLLTLTQQNNLKLFLNKLQMGYLTASNTQSSSLVSDNSKAKIDEPIAVNMTTQTQKDGLGKSDNESAFAQKSSNPLNPNKTLATVSTQKEKAPIATIAGAMKSILGKIQSSVVQNPTLAQASEHVNNMTTYASTGTKQTNTANSHISFDGNNLIHGTPKSNLLASIADVDVSNSQSLNQTSTNLRNQFILVILLSFAGFLYFMRKPRKHAPIVTQPIITRQDKILEIDQKMDGTVVVYYQNKAYKISKPELHSDSDQFIERLMNLYQPENKEMEYDNTQDAMKLTAPLSRLVTRLGFVGVKRDLFFPRTSKHSVLFRKYITRDDLTALNMTPEQIISDLSLAS